MITNLQRNFVGTPNIVTMVTDSTLATITTAGFLALPTTIVEIESLQNGTFEWLDTDVVLIAYNGGKGFFTMNAATNAFVALP